MNGSSNLFPPLHGDPGFAARRLRPRQPGTGGRSTETGGDAHEEAEGGPQVRDQWRAQATGYAGDPNALTPHLDALASENVNFTHALARRPVCSPYRASLLTGQQPLTHGVFMNDVPLRPKGPALAEAFAAEASDTADIGTWHVDGRDRSSCIAPERRLGFRCWKAIECTHDSNHSAYCAEDSDRKLLWDGYDAIAQTRDAREYIRLHATGKPFLPPRDRGTAR